jgi:hypothetical protein
VPMYVAVTSPLEPDQCAKELTSERFGMKIGSADKVEEIFRRRLGGLQFSKVPMSELPHALPRDAGPSSYFTYFQINRELQQSDWLSVESSKTLAIRFQGEEIVPDKKIPDGATKVNIGKPDKFLPFQFTLYVLVRGGVGASKPSGTGRP